MAAPTTTDRKSYIWDNTHHVQFRLAESAFDALSAEANAWGVSTNIAAKLLLTQRLDPPTYEAQLQMLRDPEVYRLDDPARVS